MLPKYPNDLIPKSMRITGIEMMFSRMSEKEKDYHYLHQPDSNISKLIAEERRYKKEV